MTTAIVQRGALKKGAVLVAGKSWAKVRFLFDENGRTVTKAGPSTAVEVVGWKDLPSAGELILEVESEVRPPPTCPVRQIRKTNEAAASLPVCSTREQQRAREVVEWRSYKEEQQRLQEEQNVIELKQQAHQEEYRKERAGLSHLSWKQRKAALYRANKNKLPPRQSERVTSDERRLQVIIKGADTQTHTIEIRTQLPNVIIELDRTSFAPPTD